MYKYRPFICNIVTVLSAGEQQKCTVLRFCDPKLAGPARDQTQQESPVVSVSNNPYLQCLGVIGPRKQTWEGIPQAIRFDCSLTKVN